MNLPDTGTKARFETHTEGVSIAPATDDMPDAESDETMADALAFLRTLGVLRGKRDEFVTERPLDALALSIVVQAASNVRRAWQTSRRIRRENRESARRRAALERYKSSDTLPRKILKEPGLALAEARSTPEGCLRVIELWRCLGDALISKNGWGDEEMKLARALAGSADSGVRTTRDRIRLDRALDSDRQRPMREMVATVERVMGHYVDRLMLSLERLEPGQRNLHEVVLESVQEKAFELMSMIGVDDREAILRFREKSMSANAGRGHWAATRAYVAARIREWRAIRNASIRKTRNDEIEAEMESFGLAEMRKAEWARKGLSAAIADFQKTLALGKAIGLPDQLCPKPPKPSRTAEASMPLRVDRSHLSAVVAETRCTEPEMQPPGDSAIRAKRVRRHRQGRHEHAAISKLSRDPRGRFASGSTCTQPRGPGGRFVKAGANQAEMSSVERSTVIHSLKPTNSGWQALMAITPNVAGRDQAARQGGAVVDFGKDGENPIESPSDPIVPAAGGATIALADFAENRQNDDLTPMPEAPEAAEPFSGWLDEKDRGVAGDDQR